MQVMPVLVKRVIRVIVGEVLECFSRCLAKSEAAQPRIHVISYTCWSYAIETRILCQI
jgi:hypothetical protein